jgi:hypothetical protein
MKKYQSGNSLKRLLLEFGLKAVSAFIEDNHILKTPEVFNQEVVIYGHVHVLIYLLDNNLIDKSSDKLTNYLLMSIHTFENNIETINLLLNNISIVDEKKVFKQCIKNGDFDALDFFEKRFNTEISIDNRIKMAIHNNMVFYFKKLLKSIKPTKNLINKIAKYSLKYNNLFVLSYISKDYEIKQEIIEQLLNRSCSEDNVDFFSFLYPMSKQLDKRQYFTLLSFNGNKNKTLKWIYEPLKTKDYITLDFKNQINKDFSFYKSWLGKELVDKILTGATLIEQKNKIMSF